MCSLICYFSSNLLKQIKVNRFECNVIDKRAMQKIFCNRLFLNVTRGILYKALWSPETVQCQGDGTYSVSHSRICVGGESTFFRCVNCGNVVQQNPISSMSMTANRRDAHIHLNNSFTERIPRRKKLVSFALSLEKKRCLYKTTPSFASVQYSNVKTLHYFNCTAIIVIAK